MPRGQRTWTAFRRIVRVRPVEGEDGYQFHVGLEGAARSVVVDAYTLMSYELFRAAALTQLGRPFRDAWVEAGRVRWEEVVIPKWCFDDGSD